MTTVTFNYRPGWLWRVWNWLTFYNWRQARRYRGKKIVIDGKQHTIEKFKGKTVTTKEPLPVDLQPSSTWQMPPQ